MTLVGQEHRVDGVRRSGQGNGDAVPHRGPRNGFPTLDGCDQQRPPPPHRHHERCIHCRELTPRDAGLGHRMERGRRRMVQFRGEDISGVRHSIRTIALRQTAALQAMTAAQLNITTPPVRHGFRRADRYPRCYRQRPVVVGAYRHSCVPATEGNPLPRSHRLLSDSSTEREAPEQPGTLATSTVSESCSWHACIASGAKCPSRSAAWRAQPPFCTTSATPHCRIPWSPCSRKSSESIIMWRPRTSFAAGFLLGGSSSRPFADIASMLKNWLPSFQVKSMDSMASFVARSTLIPSKVSFVPTDTQDELPVFPIPRS